MKQPGGRTRRAASQLRLLPREAPAQKGPITRYGQAAGVGAGTFREPINILITFCACLRPDLDIYFPFRIKSEIPAMRHENKKRVHLPAEHRGAQVRPHSVSRNNWTQPSACILHAVYRRPMLVLPASHCFRTTYLVVYTSWQLPNFLG